MKYENRLRHFCSLYGEFYQGQRAFVADPEQQFAIFDFPDIGFCVAALNSCFNNDPLRRAGAFHPAALTATCKVLREPSRAGWLMAAAWHHNLVGGPAQDDYMDPQFIQMLIDAGVSLGFHGHQHLADCFDERYRIGINPRKMTVISASTLCAEPGNLSPGSPRSYNIVELDTEGLTGRVHQRQMVNRLYSLPIWGPGHFVASNKSFANFELCGPLTTRPRGLDINLQLEKAEELIGRGCWRDAIALLEEVQEAPLARPLLAHALSNLDDAKSTIATLWPPRTIPEAILIGGAILEDGTKENADAFLDLGLVAGATDASLREVTRRIRERRMA